MKIERRVEENGAITDVITITEEENAAIDQAHEIVAERYKQMGLEQTAWEKCLGKRAFGICSSR